MGYAMKDRRKVLIISYHYLPEITAASFRIFAWAKYLTKFAWEPIILTRNSETLNEDFSHGSPGLFYKDIDKEIDCMIYRTKYEQYFKDILALRRRLSDKENPSIFEIMARKSINFIINNFLMIPDLNRGWYEYAYHTALQIINEHDIECILSTGAPWTDFRIAHDLCKKTRIPWIADYRDPWSQVTSLGIEKGYIIWYPINRIYERKVVKNASAFIHISEPLRHDLSKMIRRPVHLIPNGFDEEIFKKFRQCIPSEDIFTISSIGTLHSDTTTNMFLEGFHKFVRENNISPNSCKVLFTGHGYESIKQDYVEFSEIQDFVTFNPPVSQDKAVENMFKSHVLLLFPLDMDGCCPAKTFEYLASGRPILVTPGGFQRNVIKDILIKTNAGVILHSSHELSNWLREKFNEFTRSGRVNATTNHEAVNEYSRERQVEQLAQILNVAISKA